VQVCAIIRALFKPTVLFSKLIPLEILHHTILIEAPISLTNINVVTSQCPALENQFSNFFLKLEYLKF
jgi:hypothetical protein